MSPRAPTHDAQRIRSHHTLRDQVIDTGHDVFISLLEIVPHDVEPVLLAVVGRAPIVGQEHHIPGAGVHHRVDARIPAQQVRRGGAAVDLYDERVATPRLVADGLHQDSADGLAVLRLPAELFCRAECELSRLRVGVGEPAPAALIGEVGDRRDGVVLVRGGGVAIDQQQHAGRVVLDDEEGAFDIGHPADLPRLDRHGDHLVGALDAIRGVDGPTVIGPPAHVEVAVVASTQLSPRGVRGRGGTNPDLVVAEVGPVVGCGDGDRGSVGRERDRAFPRLGIRGEPFDPSGGGLDEVGIAVDARLGDVPLVAIVRRAAETNPLAVP